MAKRPSQMPVPASGAAPADADVAAFEDRFAAERAASQPRKAPAWPRPANPGKRFEIRTPNRQFNGERARVRFQEGVAFTDDARAAEDCARFGYEVTDVQQAAS